MLNSWIEIDLDYNPSFAACLKCDFGQILQLPQCKTMLKTPKECKVLSITIPE